MQKIKIISTPPGFAPEYIREQWIGVELSTLGREDPEKGLEKLRTGIENLGGYQVDSKDAIEALRKAEKYEAFAFWEPILKQVPILVFNAEVCELIEGSQHLKILRMKPIRSIFYNGKSTPKRYYTNNLSTQ